MAKLYAAAVFAFIAAMVIVITGLSSDARFITIILRSIIGFVTTGLIVYIVLRILAARDIIDFDDFLEARDEEALAEVDADTSVEEQDGSSADGQPMAEEADSGEAGEPVQFEPLNSNDLTRMDSPK